MIIRINKKQDCASAKTILRHKSNAQVVEELKPLTNMGFYVSKTKKRTLIHKVIKNKPFRTFFGKHR